MCLLNFLPSPRCNHCHSKPYSNPEVSARPEPSETPFFARRWGTHRFPATAEGKPQPVGWTLVSGLRPGFIGQQEPIDWSYLPYKSIYFWLKKKAKFFREYPSKIWPEIRYSTSILGSWRSPIDGSSWSTGIGLPTGWVEILQVLFAVDMENIRKSTAK